MGLVWVAVLILRLSLARDECGIMMVNCNCFTEDYMAYLVLVYSACLAHKYIIYMSYNFYSFLRQITAVRHVTNFEKSA